MNKKGNKKKALSNNRCIVPNVRMFKQNITIKNRFVLVSEDMETGTRTFYDRLKNKTVYKFKPLPPLSDDTLKIIDDHNNKTSEEPWICKIFSFLDSGKPYEIEKITFLHGYKKSKVQNPDVPWPWSWTARYVLGETKYNLDKEKYPSKFQRKYQDIKFWLNHGLTKITTKSR